MHLFIVLFLKPPCRFISKDRLLDISLLLLAEKFLSVAEKEFVKLS